MANEVILPTVFYNESPGLPFDFTSRLPVGVSVSSATAACAVESGVDANPSALIGTPVLTTSYIVTIPKVVNQGVNGVIYRIRVRATGSDAKIYDLEGLVAVFT